MTKVKLERTYRNPDSCAHVPLFKMTQLHVDTYFKDGYTKGVLIDTLSMPNGKQAALVQVSSREGEAEPAFCHEKLSRLQRQQRAGKRKTVIGQLRHQGFILLWARHA